MTEEFNENKMKEMIHYIIYKCSKNKNFGKIVLFKLLYFSDFNFYKKNMVAISNESYKKMEFGPAPIHANNILTKLNDEDKINYFSNEKDSTKPWVLELIERPKIEYLSADEIKEIDNVIKKVGHLTAKDISELSHKDNPYISSKINEIMDYGLVFYRSECIEKIVE